MKFALVVFAALMVCCLAQAAVFKNQDEVAQMMDGTRQSMLSATQAHFRAYEKTGIGLLYGYISSYSKMSSAEQDEFIQEHKIPGSRPVKPTITSCESWVRKHLGQGYKAVGKEARWKEILKVAAANDFDGLFMMQELQKDGWEVVYWNPDVNVAKDGNKEHTNSWNTVRTKGTYYGIRVQHTLVNFRPTAGSPTVQDLSGMQKLSKIPLWVGLTWGGYHVFIGHNERLNESHSPYNPQVRENVQDSNFQTWGLAGARKYLSGIILVPPGTWPQ